MKLNGRNLGFVSKVATGTIALSMLAGCFAGAAAAFDILGGGGAMQSAGAIAAVVPSFAGVLLAAFAILKQVESSTPEVVISNKLEVNFSLARIRLHLFKDVIQALWQNEETSWQYIQGHHDEPEASEQDYEAAIERHENAGPTAAEQLGFPDEYQSLHHRFHMHLDSSNGGDDPSLLQLLIGLAPVILALERAGCLAKVLPDYFVNKNRERITDLKVFLQKHPTETVVKLEPHRVWMDQYEVITSILKAGPSYWSEDYPLTIGPLRFLAQGVEYWAHGLQALHEHGVLDAKEMQRVIFSDERNLAGRSSLISRVASWFALSSKNNRASLTA